MWWGDNNTSQPCSQIFLKYICRYVRVCMYIHFGWLSAVEKLSKPTICPEVKVIKLLKTAVAVAATENINGGKPRANLRQIVVINFNFFFYPFAFSTKNCLPFPLPPPTGVTRKKKQKQMVSKWFGNIGNPPKYPHGTQTITSTFDFVVVCSYEKRKKNEKNNNNKKHSRK